MACPRIALLARSVVDVGAGSKNQLSVAVGGWGAAATRRADPFSTFQYINLRLAVCPGSFGPRAAGEVRP